MAAAPEEGASLPPPPDRPLEGRGSVLDRLERLVADHRWVSVIGPIGVGKTRLVLELAHRARDSAGTAGQGVAWLALGDDGTGLDALESPPRHAAAELLVVDTGDAVPPELAGAVTSWLRGEPGRRVLVSCRRPLGLPDEAVLTLDRVDRAAGRAILQAHLARDVREAAPADQVAVDERDGAFDRVVDAVDGLPLLLGWIAPFVARLGADRLADKLDLDPFLVIAEGSAGDRPRHRRLREALAEPIRALPEIFLRVLEDATVFQGPFRLEDAHAVISAPPADLGDRDGRAGDALEAVLAALAVRGLLRSGRTVEGTPWFAAWALVRAHLRADATRPGGVEPSAAVRRRYEERVLALAATGDDPAPLRLEDELDRIAHRRAADVGTDTDGLRSALEAATELARAVLDRAPLGRATALLDTLLAPGDATSAALTVDPGTRARGWWARGRLRLRAGDAATAADDLHRAAVLASEAGLHDLVGHAYCDLGRALGSSGDPAEARARYRAAAILLRGAKDAAGLARVEAHRATLAHELGDLPKARRAYEAALSLSDEIDDRVTAGVALQNLGLVDLEAGDLERAADRFAQALATHREVGHRRFEGVAAADRGLLRLRQGRPGAARRHLRQAADLLRETGDAEGRLLAQARLAGSLAELGKIRRSRALVVRTIREAAKHRLVRARRVAALEGAQGDLAVARHAWALDDSGRWEDERQTALAVAERAQDRSDEQVRLSRTRLDEAIAGTEELADALLVDVEGEWMRPPGGARVDLRRSPVLRAVLGALVATRLDAGSPAGRDALREAAWPEERMRPASARNRLDVALSKLRGQGLEGILVRADDGYTLDVRVPVLIAAPSRRRG